jgi:DNA-binding MarR family transcriptional regulator
VRPAPIPPDAAGYVIEDQIGFQLRIAMQRHMAIFTQRMVGGITQTQFATMVKLYQVGPCSQTTLARLVALDSATINGVLQRLRARGFVSSTPDTADRRQRTATLTAKGRAAAEQALGAATPITEETVAPLTATERRQLARLLTKIS